MAVMVVCGLMLIAALALAVRWRHYVFTPEPAVDDPPLARLRSLVRVLAVGALTGIVVGILVIGPAGRLAMRLLAATSPDAQGRITEADEVVGRITLGGTIGFIVFAGIFFGLGVGLLYVFVARAFPRGVLGGAIYGAALLVLFSWWQDPLVAENRDFDILEPGWLAVITFAAMALVTGAATAPIAGRISAAVAEPRVWWVVWLAPLGMLALGALVSAPPILLIVALAALIFMLLPELDGLLRGRGRLMLQVLVGSAIVIALPGFLSAVVGIA